MGPMSHDHHDHDHDHDHDHPGAHDAPLTGPALRVKALESLLVEKGLVEPAALDQLMDGYKSRGGPRNCTRVVARAWTEPAYKRRLLADTSAAMAEFGFTGRPGEHVV